MGRSLLHGVGKENRFARVWEEGRQKQTGVCRQATVGLGKDRAGRVGKGKVVACPGRATAWQTSPKNTKTSVQTMFGREQAGMVWVAGRYMLKAAQKHTQAGRQCAPAHNATRETTNRRPQAWSATRVCPTRTRREEGGREEKGRGGGHGEEGLHIHVSQNGVARTHPPLL